VPLRLCAGCERPVCPDAYQELVHADTGLFTCYLNRPERGVARLAAPVDDLQAQLDRRFATMRRELEAARSAADRRLADLNERLDERLESQLTALAAAKEAADAAAGKVHAEADRLAALVGELRDRVEAVELRVSQ
jgi:hypothetical protein